MIYELQTPKTATNHNNLFHLIHKL
jgi:hypothetical protein